MLVAALLALAANPYLSDGKDRFTHLQYDQALAPLTLATQVPGQSQSERREAYDLLARTRAALGDLQGATAAYTELLEKDAVAPAPIDAAPKIREAFRAAKTALFPPGTVKLTRAPSVDSHLIIDCFDPWSAVVRLDVHEVGGTRMISVNAAASVDVRVPSGFALGWVDAVNANGASMATLGSTKAPLRLARASAPVARATTSSSDRSGVLKALREEACAAAHSNDATRAIITWKKLFSLESNTPAPDECRQALPAYYAVRGSYADKPSLAVKVSALLTPQGGAHFELEAQNDLMSLVQQARFHLRTPAGWSDVVGFVVDQPSPVLGYWVEAVGELGVLITVGSPTDQLVPTASDAPVITTLTPVATPISLTASAPKPWRIPLTISTAGLAVVAAGLGLGFGVAARADAAKLSGLTTYTGDITQRDAFSLAGRQRSEAITANIALGLAAGFVVTSFLIWVVSAEPAS